MEACLEPWPTKEVVFVDLPALPDGVALRVAPRICPKPMEAAAYVSGYHSGLLVSLVHCDSRWELVEGGRAMVAAETDRPELAVFLEGNGRYRRLVTNGVVSRLASKSEHTTVGVLEVRLPAAEVQRAIAEVVIPTGG